MSGTPTSIIGEDEQVNEKEHHNKGVEDEGKAEDQIAIFKVKTLFRKGRAATDLMISNSRRLPEIMTKLEELIPGARSPVKRVRNIAIVLVGDVLISDRPKRLRSRTPILSQDSFESDRFLMQIDEIEKNYMGSQDKMHHFPQFDIPSFSLGVSQEEKEVLPEGVLIVDSQPNSLAAVVQVQYCYVPRKITFIDRSLMRIAEHDLQTPNVKTPTNTDKYKDVLVEAPKRRRMRTSQCIISALQVGHILLV
ncbi:hypothetical protein Cgig2_015297 [Carnegiea gigantea]|uniref:Uncharacterized protein n=1 Tax=Carnegiea gigantea TaxID=171969 RepID=A0A9Q1JFN7_9CARY|nr:hypothetical protein Cgig2_015297 [Carnegiea gigantea]